MFNTSVMSCGTGDGDGSLFSIKEGSCFFESALLKVILVNDEEKR
jgi:hypothetical protein